MRNSERWTEPQIRDAIAVSRALSEALRLLGGEVGDGHSAYEFLRKYVIRKQISTVHFVKGYRPPRETSYRRTFTPEQLRDAVAASSSVRGALLKLGIAGYGGNYRQFYKYVAEEGISTAHFTGSRWNKGRPNPASRRPLEQILRQGFLYQSQRLKRRLWAEGLKPKHCELCGWAQYSEDGRLPLELDHKNGDPTDNRIENLRILCPNCHSLQPTHRARNRQSVRERRAAEERSRSLLLGTRT